ncbi:MAG: radical SAM family heme chaperone HemW [Clostridia bacterium]|nr:radical SAM family heme chaperone HemW [Clostridia bacterium]
MKKLGLYIHIPFCKKKCNYCDFYSCTSIKGLREYISAICTQIEREAPLYREYLFDTIFIGGGTPSLLESNDFSLLVATIKSNLNLTQGAEFSIEANPGTITKEKLTCYKENGVNRLSIGLQSTNNEELKLLGRIHSYDTFLKNYQLARDCGFNNINIDVMYSLPNQKTNDFLETLKRVIALNPEHISSYCLKIEENTPFGKMEYLPLPDEDEEYNMYISMCELLTKNSYDQYEISNFSKKGYNCRHNLKYWLSEDYIGIGPSAHSYFDGKRYSYIESTEQYIKQIKENQIPNKIYEQTEENTHSSPQMSKMDEYVMLKMRLSSGVNREEFESKFGEALEVAYPKITSFIQSEYIVYENGAYSFTPKGFFVSNYILTEILKF